MEGLTPSKTGKECYEREEEEKLPSYGLGLQNDFTLMVWSSVKRFIRTKRSLYEQV